MTAALLEKLLGDPFDDANPVGFARLADADERAELLAEGERVLAEWRCNAEFVPDGLGGRWTGTDELARRLRPVFRRDGALGLGYGATSLIGAVNVWVGGGPAQQRRLGTDLLAGRRLAPAFHELRHGNDFLRNEFRAELAGDRIRLDGSKQLINNVRRAESILLFARTDDRPGARSHSLVLVHKDELAGGRVSYHPRYATAALRGCQLGGVDFAGCSVPAHALVGPAGTAAETALRAFQVTRVAVPSMAVGMLDSALHLVYPWAAGRRIYAGTVADLPHVRHALAAAFTDLLVADCLATTVARSLHLAPRDAVAPAAAVKYLVPTLLHDAMRSLAVVLGARSFLREGPYAGFGRFLRDLPVLGLGHGGATACLLTIMSQLPVLARRGWSPAAPPAALCDLAAPLPALDFGALSVAGTGRDTLAAALLAEAAGGGDAADAGAHRLIRDLAGDLHALRERCRRLPARECGPAASPETFDLAERYAVLLAAAACAATWRRHRERDAGGLLAQADWIVAALTRLAARLGRGAGLLPEAGTDVLLRELARRVERRLSCCLQPTPIFA